MAPSLSACLKSFDTLLVKSSSVRRSVIRRAISGFSLNSAQLSMKGSVLVPSIL